MDARAHYQQRTTTLGAERDRLARRDRALSTTRLVVFGALLIMALLALGRELAWWWTAVPGGGFVALVVIHGGVRQALEGLERRLAFCRRGLERLDDRWAEGGSTGDKIIDEVGGGAAHPYAGDLDLFGRGSLFQLLSIARTHLGEVRLARLLLGPTDADVLGEARRRQAAVQELAPAADMREELAVLGPNVDSGVNVEELRAWAAAPPITRLTAAWVLPLCALLATATIASFSWWMLGHTPAPFLGLAVVQGALLRWLQPSVTQVSARIWRSAGQLAVLGEVLALFERQTWSAPLLAELRQRWRVAEGEPASVAIGRLQRQLGLFSWQFNKVFFVIGLALMWPVVWGGAIERWRVRAARSLPLWLESVGELEALVSMANYAWERPQAVWPELVDEATPSFAGEELRHPLIAHARCVANDVAFVDGRRLYMVSGSNMSGKSTLLRTVGLAVVMAQAGLPVQARRLRLSALRVGATLRVSDSLQEGRSRFYAEISRLKQLVDLSHGSSHGAPPLMFLLDEILSGTNSHDRRQGAREVVAGLVAHGAIGFCTTHDLALTEMVASLPDGVGVNVHFEDRLEAGELVFDYRMRPGVVQRSNALELMRAVGLVERPAATAKGD